MITYFEQSADAGRAVLRSALKQLSWLQAAAATAANTGVPAMARARVTVFIILKECNSDVYDRQGNGIEDEELE